MGSIHDRLEGSNDEDPNDLAELANVRFVAKMYMPI